MTRSIGIEEAPSDGCFERKEMSTAEFASGIPFHLDYILFDMCFSAGIEVFYALKDKADYIGGSAAEVLAAGMFDYTKITDYLFKTPEADLEGLFKAGFQMYMDQSGVSQSSTVMLARTSGLDALAATCRRLFEKAGLDYDKALSSAKKPGFKAVPLKAKSTFSMDVKYEIGETCNVGAVLPGTDLKDECVAFSAH